MNRIIITLAILLASACAGEVDCDDPEPQPVALQCETIKHSCASSGCESISKCNRDPLGEFGPAVKCEKIEGQTFKCSW